LRIPLLITSFIFILATLICVLNLILKSESSNDNTLTTLANQVGSERHNYKTEEGDQEVTTTINHVQDLSDLESHRHVIIDFSFETLKSKFSAPSLLPIENDGSQVNVKSVTIKSPLTQNALHYILHYFISIQTLEIDVDAICLGFQIQAKEDIISETIHLKKLSTLNLKNGVHCPVFQWGFTVNTSSLSAVHISNFRLNPENFQALYSHLVKSEHSLKNISIAGSFVCADGNEQFCGVNKFRFGNLEKFKVTRQIHNESFFLRNVYSIK